MNTQVFLFALLALTGAMITGNNSVANSEENDSAFDSASSENDTVVDTAFGENDLKPKNITNYTGPVISEKQYEDLLRNTTLLGPDDLSPEADTCIADAMKKAHTICGFPATPHTFYVFHMRCRQHIHFQDYDGLIKEVMCPTK